ncbi:hypothetical protein BASA81_012106 [Batrachochytrium salamandrivorans]|nr:hypothetical protein BASA81_012106 [Batrachochytrium salamandrivorans]
MADRRHLIRGAFSSAEDQSLLRGGIPTFHTKQKAVDWCKEVSESNGNLHPEFKHAITTFVGWKEVEEYLVPRLSEPMEHMENEDNEGAILPELEHELEWRLQLPHHVKLSRVSSMNSLKYAFHQMRCGILVQLRNNAVYTFAPFVNDKYTNSWGDKLETDFGKDFGAYYKEKLKHYRPENVLPDRCNWWANGNIICNEHDNSKSGITQWWGDNMLMPFKHMLEEACKERFMPDVDFFFNKRDHPQLRVDPEEEAYDFMFDAKHVKLPPNARYQMLTPFCSFYGSNQFSDLLCPTVEDWKNAIGLVFPETTIETGLSTNPVSDLYLEENFKQFHVEWVDKQDTAFFRGNATGGGVTPLNNQRLHLAQLSVKEWINKPGLMLLDARVTGFNVRDKKMFGEPMRFAQTKTLKDLKGAFVPMYKQGTYKYVCYVEGHCAANRYAFLMRLGSVILKLESTCAASELWFFPMLKPQDCSRDMGEEETDADHVPVKADLSDLEEKILWCRRNDRTCRRIVENAQALYQRVLSRDAILNYWQRLVGRMAQNRFQFPSFYEPAAPVPQEPPRPHVLPTFCDHKTKQLCVRCKDGKLQ